MNILHAIKSGKPFRRAGTIDWKTKHFLQSELRCSSMDNFGLLQQQPPTVKKVLEISIDDLLSDDWEIQEPISTISRRQFWDSVQSCTSVSLGAELALDYAAIMKLAALLGVGDKP